MLERQTLIFAVYIPIGNSSPQRAKESIAQFMNMLKEDPLKPNQYNEKYIVMPTKLGEGKIELLYPTPFLTEEQADKLHDSYYAKYEDIINQIEEL